MKKSKLKTKREVRINIAFFLGSAIAFLALGIFLTFQAYKCPNVEKQNQSPSVGTEAL